MKSNEKTRREACNILLTLIVALGCVLPGQAGFTETLEEEKAEKLKEFLSDPDVVTCTLKSTAISKLDVPDNRLRSFIQRMKRQNREDVKEGLITLANRSFRILLGERLEREFCLFDTENQTSPYWWGSWNLYSYHKIDDKFYEFILFENGTKIAVRPYKGPLGTFKIGKGGRDLEKLEFNGSVHQKEYVSSPIGTIEESWPGMVVECKIPVGDYTPYIMRVTYDNLSISISNNYHTNAQGQSKDKETVYGIQVREDKPYVLDFSNDPVVVFDQPPMSNTVFSRGEEIKFAAVLVDPKLDIMIRGLDDTSGRINKYEQTKSLDPKVVITRENGEIVAQGVMPFG